MGDQLMVVANLFIKGTVNQVFALITEPHWNRLLFTPKGHSDRDHQGNIMVPGPHLRLVPEESCSLHRDVEYIEAIERSPRPLMRRGTLPRGVQVFTAWHHSAMA